MNSFRTPPEIIDAEIISENTHSIQNVHIPLEKYRDLQANSIGWKVLLGAIAAFFFCLCLAVLQASFKSSPAANPRCEQNCTVEF